jgi:glycine/D-amino acid oxidase-like deaminating enzyme
MKYFSPSHLNRKNLRPPDLYEYFVDNFWFNSEDLADLKLNPPLRGSHQADIVIIGGGYTGLSAGYNLRKNFPNKHIVLLEGACCGYGASGRNGGFCISTDFLDGLEDSDPETRQKAFDFASHGLQQIKQVIAEYDIDCDLEETGMLDVALNDKHTQSLQEYHAYYQKIGLESTLLTGAELGAQIKSPVFKAGLLTPHGAILNPAKLAQGMKRVNQALGVEIFERSVVTRISPGKLNHIDTELGEIQAPVVVIATNAYSHKLGFFKDRVVPIAVFQIATAPLSDAQWQSIGWGNRQGLSDMRALFSYSRPTADGRIVMGGVNSQYYPNDALASGNDKVVTEFLENNLFFFFPQLKGLKIDHAWGGTTALTLRSQPSIGVLGDYQNVYYGVGYSEGVPITQTAGRIIADLIAGESNDFTNHPVVNQNIRYVGPTKLRRYFADVGKWLMNKFDLPLYR